jgi:hypothetical protein
MPLMRGPTEKLMSLASAGIPQPPYGKDLATSNLTINIKTLLKF